MVVANDHRCGVVGQGATDQFAGVHFRAVHGALEHLLERQRPVPRIQEQGCEHLVPVATQALGEVAAGRSRIGEDFAAFQRGGQMTMAQFQRCTQLAGAGGAETWQLGQGMWAVFQQDTQGTMRGEQVARGLYRVPALQARAQEDRQQFRIRQRCRATGQQFLAGRSSAGQSRMCIGRACLGLFRRGISQDISIG